MSVRGPFALDAHLDRHDLAPSKVRQMKHLRPPSAAPASSGWASMLTATAAVRAMRRGEFSATEYVRAALETIDRTQARHGAFVETYPSAALQRALEIDQQRGSQPGGALEGVVFAVKDSIAVAGTAMGAGSRSTRTDDPPSTDADVVAKLRAAGAILVGKVVLEELGIGPTTQDTPTPAARNPWNPARSTGGSSSGCAVATACGLVPFAIGADSAGSIRLPAAHCGTVGFKPTYGLVHVGGVLPLAPSLDHVGITARDVVDVDLVLQSVVGARPLSELAPQALRDAHIGIVGTRATPGVDDEVRAAFARAIDAMEARGASCEPVALAPIATYQQCGATILHAEAYREHRERLRHHRSQMHPATYRRLSSGARISDAELAGARERQAHLGAEFDAIIAPFDALAIVTTLAPPGPANDVDLTDERSMTPSPRMPFNVVGAPAVAVPIGFTRDGMPLSMQLVGGRGRDRRLLGLAAAFQREVGVDAPLAEPRPASRTTAVGCGHRRATTRGEDLAK
jgi:aspartyl-tRNA(Asn)/glutamyl-tRNA(Gln) amidotransferase subunit A